MQVTVCDICRKRIKNRQEVSIGYLVSWPQYALCLKCAKPIIAFLQKHKLFDEIEK